MTPSCPHCRALHPVGAAFCPETGLALAPAAPLPATPPATALGSAPPPGAVRHSYPLAVEQAGLGTAVGLLMKTLPYAALRFAVLVGATIATIVFWVIAIGGAAFLAAKVAPAVGWIWAIAWLVAFGFFWRLFLRYFLYLLNAGHVAVITELLTTGRIGNGSEGMFAYGRRVVKERFGEVTALFAVDLVVKGVVRALNRTLDFVGSLLPIPGVQQLVRLVNAVLYAATTYVDETIFSYGLARQERNPWASARDGLVYYAQNTKEILKTAVGVVLLDYALSFVMWLILLAPAYAISRGMPQAVSGATILAWLIALLLAGSFRAAFLKPLGQIMVMTKFHVAVRGQPIDEAWVARLEGLSDKFRSLRDRIVGAPARLPG
jgi:hypothetical protein